MRVSIPAGHGAATDDNHDKEVFGYFREDIDDIPSEKKSLHSSAKDESPKGSLGITVPFGVVSFLRHWWTESLWPGMGLFGESYLLFSIGTLTPLWKEIYPDCWVNDQNGEDDSPSENNYYAYEYDGGLATATDVCSPRLLESLTYGVVLGVIVGMVLLGYWSNHIGRRKGSILTASLMAGGSLGLMALSVFGATRWSAQSVFQGTLGCLVLFGVGVGGEYPLSASLASEKATEELTRNRELLAEKERKHNYNYNRRPLTMPMPATDPSGIAIAIDDDDDGDDDELSSPADRQAHYGHISSVSTLQNGDRKDRYQKSNRGRRVQLVFAMQGMGIWFNSLTMLILLWALTSQSNGTNKNNNNNDGGDGDGYETFEYDVQALFTVWRVTYGIGALVLCFVLLTRILYLEESKIWLNANKVHSSRGSSSSTGGISSSTSTGHHRTDACVRTDSTSLHSIEPSDDKPPPKMKMEMKTKPKPTNRIKLVHQQYGSRMFGAGMAWLLWDISFYGNKLFQSTFLLALVGENASLIELTGAAALNATVALLGYYGAAILVDLPPQKRWWWNGGRKTLQSIGLLVTGGLFLACGVLASSSNSSSKGGRITVFLYLLSSLVGQLGPNCTTFLIPTEIVPTDQRTYCHGVCAALGKVGALLAAVVFHFVGGTAGSSSNNSSSGASLFYLCGGAGVLGAVVTHVFVPETAGLDLLELDLHWKLLLEGEREGKDCYDGPAVHHDHLSLYERYCLRRRRRRQHDLAEGDDDPMSGYWS